ncbi:hypothetical protein [Pinibacter aurantiacus]|uniref:Uncharacterized protein n=1 Tax=Pinibacter aurantiacus TaxID=2851599 RepID=A0A9E2SC30_9BACT|nr:hypothetical protein [Pinibacter aurantiacus]MBV4360246.1 hypothetical protein [Pinibacter aurantiacus]
MIKSILTISAFALMICIIHFPFSFPTSVVPGWHLTIYPIHLLITIIIATLLLLGAIGYLVLSRINDRINKTLYMVHFVLTATTVVYICFPTIWLDMRRSDESLLPAIAGRITLIPYAWGVFIAAQTLFLIYFFRTAKKPNENPIS